MLTKEHAETIAKKLKATIRSKPAHDLAIVEYNNKRIVQFGIRRGSRHDSGHDHLPADLHLTPHDTMELARCPLTRDEWI
jgi:hypothetical protein